MSTTTSRLGLYKTASDGSEYVNVVTDLLNNYDTLDLAIGSRVVTSTTRPSTPYSGQHILESDTGYRTLVHNGTTPASAGWIEIPNNSATYGGQIWASRAADVTTLRIANTAAGGNTVASILTEHATATAATYGARVAGDSFDRFRIRADGRIDIGPGTGARDTNLYRASADTLKTDDSFVIGSTLAVTGAATVGGALTVVGNLSVSGVGQWLATRKASDTSRSATTTMSADPDLTSMAVAASGVYRVQGTILYSAHQDGDLKVQFTAPSGASLSWHGYCLATGLTSTTGVAIYDVQSLATAYTPGGADTTNTPILALIINGTLTISSTAGNFGVQWAQNTSHATATILRAGSTLALHRIV